MKLIKKNIFLFLMIFNLAVSFAALNCADKKEEDTTNTNGTTNATPVCGNAKIETGEQCDDGQETETCDSTCKASYCGNGTINATAGEQCDDKGESAACTRNCLNSSCGDSIVNTTAGETCDDGNTISGDGCAANCTIEIPAYCGNGIVDAGEQCDDSGESANCNNNCTTRTCGDSIVNAIAGEACDDGGTVAGDGCAADCTIEIPAYCGNGVTDTGEACDDNGESATCNSNCTARSCGDFIVNATAGEQCDDGGTVAGDGCDSNCIIEIPEYCGNGIVDAGESCDDSGTQTSTCEVNCQAPTCGDGILNVSASEQCEDGNTVIGDGCDASCLIEIPEFCGNGTVNTGEACDSSGTQTSTCEVNCTSPNCGDGILNAIAGEQCEDGNTTANDGCSSTCQLEYCGDNIVNGTESCDDGVATQTATCEAYCSKTPACGDGIINALASEQCEDGNTTAGDGCDASCLVEVPQYCGNGTLDTGETCDEGVTTQTSTCEANCKTPVCGDGIINTLAGESCEDGNTANNDGCSSTCQSEEISLSASISGSATSNTVSNSGTVISGSLAKLRDPLQKLTGPVVLQKGTPCSGSYGVYSIGGDGTALSSGTLSADGSFASDAPITDEVVVQFAACGTASFPAMKCLGKAGESGLICDPLSNGIIMALEYALDPTGVVTVETSADFKGLEIYTLVKALGDIVRVVDSLSGDEAEEIVELTEAIEAATTKQEIYNLFVGSMLGSIFEYIRAAAVAKKYEADPVLAAKNAWPIEKVIQLIITLGVQIRVDLDGSDGPGGIYSDLFASLDTAANTDFFTKLQNYLSTLFDSIYVSGGTFNIAMVCYARDNNNWESKARLYPPIDTGTTTPGGDKILTCYDATILTNTGTETWRYELVLMPFDVEVNRNDPTGKYDNKDKAQIEIGVLGTFPEFDTSIMPGGVCEGFVDFVTGIIDIPGLSNCIITNNLSKYFSGLFGIYTFLQDPASKDAKLSLNDIYTSFADVRKTGLLVGANLWQAGIQSYNSQVAIIGTGGLGDNNAQLEPYLLKEATSTTAPFRFDLTCPTQEITSGWGAICLAADTPKEDFSSCSGGTSTGNEYTKQACDNQGAIWTNGDYNCYDASTGNVLAALDRTACESGICTGGTSTGNESRYSECIGYCSGGDSTGAETSSAECLAVTPSPGTWNPGPGALWTDASPLGIWAAAAATSTDMTNFINSFSPSYNSTFSMFEQIPDISEISWFLYKASAHVDYNIMGSKKFWAKGFDTDNDWQADSPILCKINNPGNKNSFVPGTSYISCIVADSTATGGGTWNVEGKPDSITENFIKTNKYVFSIQERGGGSNGVDQYYGLFNILKTEDLTLNGRDFRLRGIETTQISSALCLSAPGDCDTSGATVYPVDKMFCNTYTDSQGNVRSECWPEKFEYVAVEFLSAWFPPANYSVYGWHVPFNDAYGNSWQTMIGITSNTTADPDSDPFDDWAVCVKGSAVTTGNSESEIASTVTITGNIIDCFNNTETSHYYYLATDWGYTNKADYKYNLLRNDGMSMNSIGNCSDPLYKYDRWGCEHSSGTCLNAAFDNDFYGCVNDTSIWASGNTWGICDNTANWMDKTTCETNNGRWIANTSVCMADYFDNTITYSTQGACDAVGDGSWWDGTKCWSPVGQTECIAANLGGAAPSWTVTGYEKIAIGNVETELGGNLMGPSAAQTWLNSYEIANLKHDTRFDPFCIDHSTLGIQGQCDCIDLDGDGCGIDDPACISYTIQSDGTAACSAAEKTLSEPPIWPGEPASKDVWCLINNYANDTTDSTLSINLQAEAVGTGTCAIVKGSAIDISNIYANWHKIFECSNGDRLEGVDTWSIINDEGGGPGTGTRDDINVGGGCGTAIDGNMGPVRMRRILPRNNSYVVDKPGTLYRLITAATANIGTGVTIDPSAALFSFEEALPLVLTRLAIPVEAKIYHNSAELVGLPVYFKEVHLPGKGDANPVSGVLRGFLENIGTVNLLP
ncbi:MAG: DUF4215 domain-containing protein [Spirochaetia bacterium]|nr:DUF4215 domain-containing protein [Spirochaetia bacterium]